MRLFACKALPGRWVGEDKHGGLVHWPAEPGGWAQRTPYTGSKRALEEVEPARARGTGWPGVRGGRRPRGEAPAKPVSIRATVQERANWERAAEDHELTLSDWCRDTLNRESTPPRSGSKP